MPVGANKPQDGHPKRDWLGGSESRRDVVSEERYGDALFGEQPHRARRGKRVCTGEESSRLPGIRVAPCTCSCSEEPGLERDLLESGLVSCDTGDSSLPD